MKNRYTHRKSPVYIFYNSPGPTFKPFSQFCLVGSQNITVTLINKPNKFNKSPDVIHK